MNKGLHFKGLNGIRAIAAIAVVFSHTALSLKDFNLQPVFGYEQDGSLKGYLMAGFGVTMFFALSGFLITYLLFAEENKKPINIKYFYYRRFLRIWPLYFLHLIISLIIAFFFAIQFESTVLPYYIFFGANVAFLLNLAPPFMGHLWSVSVEEQFYLIWPWFIKLTNKYFLHKVFIIIVILMGLKICFHFLPNGEFISQIIHVTRFHCMLIGAMGAFLYFNRSNFFLKFSTHFITQSVCWIIFLLIGLNRFHIISVIDNEIVAVVTTLIIMGQITGINKIISLENRAFDFLGKISYGIYVLHPIIIFIIVKLIGTWEINNILKYGLVFSSIIFLTILAAYFSYHYYEKLFLKLKNNFTIIHNTNSSL